MERELTRFETLPTHIGFIMDGNGRWAKQRGLARSAGHVEGAKTFKRIADYGSRLGIRYMTFYAFSTENWKRPAQEVDKIMSLFAEYLDWILHKRQENELRGVRVRFLGDRSKLSQELIDVMDYVEAETRDKDKCTISIAINYGGRDDVLHGVRQLLRDVEAGILSADDITENDISKRLYTGDMPDPDLIVRPSGEYRLSNFLTWQSAYSELWFSDVLWPDFDEDMLDACLRDYEKRQRRFGGV